MTATELAVGAPPYQYSIFLSYARNPYWDKVVGIFQHHLEGMITSRIAGTIPNCNVFRDTAGIKPGNVIAEKLAERHARSRVIVPLLTGQYSGPLSPWCEAELGLMLDRRRQLREQHVTADIIFPITFQPTIRRPDLDGTLETTVTDLIVSTMTLASSNSTKLETALAPVADAIAASILELPDRPDPLWFDAALERFRLAAHLQREIDEVARAPHQPLERFSPPSADHEDDGGNA